MAFFLQTQNPFSSLVIKTFITFLLLQHQNVKSQEQSTPLSKLETVSFGLTQFQKENPDIVLLGSASISDNILRLTKTDKSGKPFPKNVGKAAHLTPIHLWDKKTGNLADFTTNFSFVVNINGSLHGDGFTFFLSPLLHVDLPANSSGGYFGLFNPETALDPSKNPILAVEFDSFTNEWDPSFPTQVPHIGIDVGSVNSVAFAPWPIVFVTEATKQALGRASINYNSESKRLSVFVAYPGTTINISFSYVVDLRAVLPEWVRVGFSAATGELVETHDIISWSFESAL